MDTNKLESMYKTASELAAKAKERAIYRVPATATVNLASKPVELEKAMPEPTE